MAIIINWTWFSRQQQKQQSTAKSEQNILQHFVVTFRIANLVSKSILRRLRCCGCDLLLILFTFLFVAFCMENYLLFFFLFFQHDYRASTNNNTLCCVGKWGILLFIVFLRFHKDINFLYVACNTFIKLFSLFYDFLAFTYNASCNTYTPLLRTRDYRV